ncbi:germin-like protein subfamily 1 member 18 [Humulus lupulus]|uniref:germin-like protein subfamily 1 member 18 n=1 Tax=Humulus lupulus TaxID=3486 RepID=UPI002B411893|nr:germin-like protein subfamily 1 member 18 [Humulus lupulus]
MKWINFLLITLAIFGLAISIASAYDPSPLQDFCVAINNLKSGLYTNGKFCKNPKLTNPSDFYSTGLNSPGNTNNPFGSSVTTLNVDKFPGLNTLGLSLVRIDYAQNGVNPPHSHPRGSEILAVTTGTLYVGFVSSSQDGNRLYAKVLNAGDLFVFPIGLVHFEFNTGPTPVVAFTVLNSQNPGLIITANTVFGSNPPINPDLLAKAFKLDKKIVENLQKQF